MTVRIDPDQTRIVESKRKTPIQRPQYFNAGAGQKLTISEDFEAFLILLGRSRTKEAISWLKLVNDFSIYDADRDALIGTTADKDSKDAKNKYIELQPIVRSFERFRTKYSLTGFEEVTEAGLLLSDLQMQMGEIKIAGDRFNHQQIWNGICISILRSRGLSQDRQRQLKSWFAPLTAY